ncbi:MAG: cell envelope integrity protein TolA [Luteimonas sp.]|nr:cell envelope integrity protein TolA [Luteimonas sp.]
MTATRMPGPAPGRSLARYARLHVIAALWVALAMVPVHAMAGDEAPPPPADESSVSPDATDAGEPITDLTLADWGLLGDLVGTRWRAQEGGTVFVYEWVDPGRELRRTAPGSLATDISIRRGEAPGELIYRQGPGTQFTGRADADGTLTFERNFPRGTAIRMSRASEGALLVEWVRLRDGRVSYPTRYDNVSAMHAAAVRAGPSLDADPATWGVYARLLGTELFADDGMYRAWRWAEGGEIVEDRGNQGTYQIARDGEGGLLLKQRGNPSWRGTIAADGAVTWTMPTGGRLLNALGGLAASDDRPYRVRTDGDGAIIEHVRMRGHEVEAVAAGTSFRGTLPDPGDALPRVARAASPASPAAIAPANAVTSTPAPHVAAGATATTQPPALFDALFRHAGKRLVGGTSQLEIQRVDNDTLIVQFYTADGRRNGFYRIARSARRPDRLTLEDSRFGKNRREAELRPGGALFVESQDGWAHGWRYTYLFEPTTDGVVATFNSHFKNQLRITLSGMGGTTDERTVYLPLTEQRVADAVVATRVQAERERISRENRRREQQERDAMVAAVFSGLTQGVSSAMADQARDRERQQQFLDETAIRAQAIAEHRQREQQAAQQQAAQQTAQRQQASNDALARQLAEGIAYRDAQAAKATDPGLRQQWQEENDKAMQEAQRLGIGAQVGQQVASNRQAASAERAESERVAQADDAARRQEEQRQQAERQRLATAQADAERQRQQEQAEAERQKQFEARRIAEERARQEQQEAWQRSLQQARSTLQLGATMCPGGSGRYYVTGPRANVQGCVTVSYEARCTGTPSGSGSRGRQHNYVGGSCLGVGDAIAIPGSPLSCPVTDVRVDVLDVTGC